MNSFDAPTLFYTQIILHLTELVLGTFVLSKFSIRIRKMFYQSNIFKTLLFVTTATLFINCSENKEQRIVQPITTKINTQRTADYTETRNAYFGDFHIHTSWSFDAFIYNVRTTPDDAYRFGKGEAIPHVSGKPIQLGRPLDFMAVSDHSEYMGVMMQMTDKNSPLSQLPIAKSINSSDPTVSKKAFGKIGFSMATSWPYKDLIDEQIIQSTWRKIIASADRHYEPGKFTTFPAYEWTSSPAVFLTWPQYAQNMHRNVIFKGGKVSQIPFSSFDSQNPEDLWEWMELQRANEIELIAIPHNANISDGRMYALSKDNGDAMDLAYVKSRMRNEPVSEVLQIKGQSMAHPSLSPNDEFADFEVYQNTLGRSEPRVQSRAKGSFVREALKDGLAIAQEVGENPFKFGFIGSTDCHNGASNIEEDNNIGKSGLQDPTAEIRMSQTIAQTRNRQGSVGGVAGVWAKENTREAIFEAFERKEVFATSGPRIKVRFFASWDWDTLKLDQVNWVSNAYELGVPMGGDLVNAPSNTTAPSFLIEAIKDSEGANLDRVQVVKGWVDKEGQTQEQIFDVVWSDNRVVGANGKLPTVGTTVDLSTATYTNDIGATTLQTIWTDPIFDASSAAFYYLRVLEIPTPRWTTYDAVRVGVPLPDDVPATIQERAWSSPIWYSVE